jgi:hypothetical protein
LPESLEDAEHRPLTRTLFDFDEHLFRDLAAYVALLADRAESAPAARRVWERLLSWLSDVEGPRVERVDIVDQEGGRVAGFRHGGVSLPLTELSDGYRALLAVALDLVIRYYLRFWELDDPLAGKALVAIDEVDLNLHPRWQRRVVDQLTALFPGTRFVLTTHSPAIVQAAIDAKNTVLVLDEVQGAGVTVRAFSEGDLRILDGEPEGKKKKKAAARPGKAPPKRRKSAR